MNHTSRVRITTAIALLCLRFIDGYSEAVAAWKIDNRRPKRKQTTPKPCMSLPIETRRLRKEEWAKVYAGLQKPGDAFVFYDGERKLTPYGWLEFAYRPLQFSNYDEMWNRLAGYSHFHVMKPCTLPNGYAFHYGEIVPWTPSYRQAEPYIRLLREMNAEAQGKLFYAKRLNWTEAGRVNFTFIKNKHSIRLSAEPLVYSPDGPIGPICSQLPSPDLKTEKVAINGTIAVYTSGFQSLHASMLEWVDAASNLRCRISVCRNSTLTKRDLIEVAECMM